MRDVLKELKQLLADDDRDQTGWQNNTTVTVTATATASETQQTCCHLCQEIFRSQHHLNSHMNSCHRSEISDSWLHCSDCDSYEPTKVMMRRHQESLHTQDVGRSPLSCRICFEAFSTTSYFVGHSNILHQRELKKSWVKCLTCQMFLPSSWQLSDHKCSTLEKFSCHFCSGKYAYKDHFLRHVNGVHKDEAIEKWNTCQVCGWCLPTEHDLDNHMQQNHSVTSQLIKAGFKFSLDTLGSKTATTNREPQCQTNQLKPNDRSQCPKCQLCFPQHLLNDHESECEAKQRQSSESDVFNSSERESKPALKGTEEEHSSLLQCKFCPERLACGGQPLSHHCNTCHRSEISKTWLHCSDCDSYEPTVRLMKKHKESLHSKKVGSAPVSCRFCCEPFSSSSYLISHANKAHQEEIKKAWTQCLSCKMLLPSSIHKTDHNCGQETLMPCPFCEAKFSRQDALIRHVHSFHKNAAIEKWKTCQVCSLSFPTERSIKNHTEHKHVLAITKEDCTFCSKRFGSKIALINHANRNHSGSLKQTDWHRCQACKLYLPEDHVDEHGEQCKGPKGRRPTSMKCNFCPQQLLGSEALYQHCNTAHPENVADVWKPCKHCQLYYPTWRTLCKHIE